MIIRMGQVMILNEGIRGKGKPSFHSSAYSSTLKMGAVHSAEIVYVSIKL
jgi:hypothetical protein